MKRIVIKFIASAFCLLAGAAYAQPYPSKGPIKIVAAFAPGSATDIVARLVAQELTQELGATVVVDNRPGAQGQIGTGYAVRSPKDGYTLTISSSSLNSINPGLFKKLSYDVDSDFTHIVRLTTMPMLILVNGASEYKSLKQLTQKAKSGKLTFGYGSPGGQVSAVAFNRMANINSIGVSYKSPPQALTDLAGGIIDYIVADPSSARPLMQAGKIRALAVSSSERLSEWRDVPTFAESGFKEFDLITWVGLAGPSGMPDDITIKLNQVMNKSLNKPEVRQKLATLGMQPAPNTVAEQQEFVKAQLRVWQERMKEASLQPE